MQSGKQHLSISGMSCAGCVSTVEKALAAVAGVTLANVNFAEHTAMVEGEAGVETLIEAVRAAGYDGAILTGTEDQAEQQAAELDAYHTLLKKADGKKESSTFTVDCSKTALYSSVPRSTTKLRT